MSDAQIKLILHNALAPYRRGSQISAGAAEITVALTQAVRDALRADAEQKNSERQRIHCPD